jgi:hypothetical protein
VAKPGAVEIVDLGWRRGQIELLKPTGSNPATFRAGGYVAKKLPAEGKTSRI